MVVGRHDEGAWCKAAAVNDALAQTDATTLVIHDADVYTDGLPEAVQRVQDGTNWCVPHRGVHRLTEASTARYAAGEDLEGLPLSERAYLGVEGGGITVVRREVYERVPLDPRYRGWSGEDESWGWALRTLIAPPWRGKASLEHLWHPPQERMSRARGSLESQQLRKRYAHALRHESRMAALIEEAKACH